MTEIRRQSIDLSPSPLEGSITQTSTPRDENEMRLLLEKQGLVFYPRLRKAQIPKISGVKLEQKVSEEYVPQTLRSLTDLIDYLETPSITDQWGANHSGRREWRQKAMREYGDLFKKVYDNNQLRTNVITPVSVAFITLEKVIPGLDHLDLITQLRQAQEHLAPINEQSPNRDGQLIYGEAYNNMSNDEKIAFVRTLEDHILAVLRILGQGTRGKPRDILIT